MPQVVSWPNITGDVHTPGTIPGGSARVYVSQDEVNIVANTADGLATLQTDRANNVKLLQALQSSRKVLQQATLRGKTLEAGAADLGVNQRNKDSVFAWVNRSVKYLDVAINRLLTANEKQNVEEAEKEAKRESTGQTATNPQPVPPAAPPSTAPTATEIPAPLSLEQVPAGTPTGNPGAADPASIKIPKAKKAGTKLVKIPTLDEADPNNERKNNAKGILQDALAELMQPRENIPLGLHDEWYTRLGSNAVPYTGLGEDFTRKTGVNDASHKDTLRYSRLVDALNNKRFITPGWAGVRSTYANGGGRTGRSDPVDFGTVYKMDGLETAESRAQRRAEGYEQEDTRRALTRKHNVMDIPTEMERLTELAVLAQAGELTAAQRAEQQQLFTAMLNNEYNIPYMMLQEKFRTQLNMGQQEYYTMLAMYLQQYAQLNNMKTAEYAAQIGMDQARYNTMLSTLAQQFGTQLAKYITHYTQLELPIEKVMQVMNEPDYIRQGMLGAPGALNTGSPDMQAYYVASAMQNLGITDVRTVTTDQWLDLIERLNAALVKVSGKAADQASEGQ